jgi:hypothetical protein
LENKDFLRYSGPEVWPKITAYEACDRFIHRRPEISYLKARSAFLDNPEWDGLTILIQQVSKTRNKTNGKLNISKKTIAKFRYVPTRENEEEDIKQDVMNFLETLRNILCRTLPSEPLFEKWICVSFKYRFKYISSFQETWL